MGYDVSEVLIEAGNTFFSEPALFTVTETGIYNKVRESKATVSSAIGVLEHVKKPSGFLDNFSKSDSRFLYISVPLFSLSVFIENVFPSVYPRHLSHGHTHLYTKESLAWLFNKYELDQVAAWWFGVDMVDFYRCLMVQHQKNKTSGKALDLLSDKLVPILDNLQGSFDNEFFCSEVHMVLAKR